MISTGFCSWFFIFRRIRRCSWARPPGPRIAILIFSLAPFTLPTAGWGKAPAAIIAPVAAPAVSMKPRRLTLLLSLIALNSWNLEQEQGQLEWTWVAERRHDRSGSPERSSDSRV